MKVDNLSPKEEFIQLMTDNFKSNGFSDLTSRISGILYFEPEEVSLEELSERTGYCLSAISTEIRLLEGLGILRRLKKPGSRKVYFYMEKNVISKSLEIMQKKYNEVILKSKEVLPGIIHKFKKQARTSKEKQELKIIEDYYSQIIYSEGVISKMIKMLEKR